MEVTGAREAVAAGVVDNTFLEAARRAASRAARTRPAPTGAPTWSQEEIDDLVFDTVHRLGTNAVVLAAAEASLDEAFTSWLFKAMRTTLDMRARVTPGGRVMRAVDGALREEPEVFLLQNGRWGLSGDTRSTGWSGGVAPLVRTAWTVETLTTALRPSATKVGWLASRRDVRAVCAVVLEVSGPLPRLELTDVVAQRFNVPFLVRFGYLEDGRDEEGADAHAAGADLAAGDASFEDVEVQDAARWMWEQLSEGERHLLALRTGGGIRDVAAALGTKKNQVEKLNSRLDAKLRRLAEATGDGGIEAAARLLELLGQSRASRHLKEQDDSDPDET